MNDSYQEYLNFANNLADEASKTSMQYFRTSLDIDSKIDESPVTIADKNTELKIRSMIQQEYPEHGILGEEFDSINANVSSDTMHEIKLFLINTILDTINLKTLPK